MKNLQDMGETQSFNEVWLKVQCRFIQDHQDFGRATGEVFQVSLDQETLVKC